MADLKYFDGTQWVTLKGPGVDLASAVGVDTTNCDIGPADSTGTFSKDGEAVDGVQSYKLDLTLPRGTITSVSAGEPTVAKCVGDLWIDTSTETVAFESADLLYEEGNKRAALEYCLPTHGGARDGVFVVNGYIYSRDGKTWRECTSNGVDPNPSPWEQGSYILKGILPDGSTLYMDSNGREYSRDMLGWFGTSGGGAYPPAGAIAKCFFWKGEYHVTANIKIFNVPTIYQHVFNATINEWEGGTQGGGTTNGGNPIDPSKEILNGDTIWYGDSKPDGTAVLGCAKGRGSLGIPDDGEWKPVKLVDGGDSQDSFQPIDALTSYSGQIISIKYNENHDYWIAITQGSVFKSDVGSVDNWTEITLPVSKPWSSCMWDGSRWIAVSMVTGESLVLFSSDGVQWETNNSIGPMWAIGENNQRFLNVMSTNGMTVVGFSPGNCPHDYNVTKR